MMRVVGFYRGVFLNAEYAMLDLDDWVAFDSLCREFTGAIFDAQKIKKGAGLTLIKGGKSAGFNVSNSGGRGRGGVDCDCLVDGGKDRGRCTPDKGRIQ